MDGVIERPLSWDDFVSQVLPEARERLADTSAAGVDAYLAAVAAVACRVDPLRVPGPKEFGASSGFPDEVGFALTYRGEIFLAVQFRIEPGAFLPCHPHPAGSVCTLLLEGSARVENYQFVSAPDWEKKGDVLLYKTREELLRPGSINLVGNPHNNIHGFRAGPAGARGVDITTIHRPAESRPDSHFEVADEPSDAKRWIYAAVWRDK